MNAPRRARRALLFCPGTERAKIEKAAALATPDGIILDLEDAAALSRKQEAREITCTALAEVDFGSKERCVRINPVGSGLEQADCAALLASKRPPDAVMLPKTEDADAVRWLSQQLAKIEGQHGLPLGRIRILAIIETARGVVNLREIAFSDPRLDALCFGAEDMCGDTGATRTPEGREVFFARSSMVLHAAAARLQAIDTPYIQLADTEGLIRDTRESQGLGFTGRLAIHPRQVEPILGVFTPSPEEIAAARRMIEAHEQHQAAGRGVFELDGKMVDMPMIRAAERILARARAAGCA